MARSDHLAAAPDRHDLAAVVLIVALMVLIVVDALRRPTPGFRAPDEWDVEPSSAPYAGAR